MLSVRLCKQQQENSLVYCLSVSETMLFFVADGVKLIDLQWITPEALDLHHGHQDAWSSVFKKLCFFDSGRPICYKSLCSQSQRMTVALNWSSENQCGFISQHAPAPESWLEGDLCCANPLLLLVRVCQSSQLRGS